VKPLDQSEKDVVMTLATVIRDAYGPTDSQDMRGALRRLLPTNSYEWHSFGVYCFWDPETRDVLICRPGTQY